MKKITKYIIILAIIVIIVVQCYTSLTIDTKYAIEYGEVFGSYDINKVDHFLNDATLITFKGVTKPYKELRDNVIAAFREKIYDSANSYGNGEHFFVKGVQEIGINAYFYTNDYESDYVVMEIEREQLPDLSGEINYTFEMIDNGIISICFEGIIIAKNAAYPNKWGFYELI